LYENFPDVLRSSTDPQNPKSGPHVDGIVGSVNNSVPYMVSNQMKQMSIHQTVVGLAHADNTPTLQSLDVHSVKMTNPKGPQKPRGKKKNNKGKKGGGIITIAKPIIMLVG
jgi:hypothetical protein